MTDDRRECPTVQHIAPLACQWSGKITIVCVCLCPGGGRSVEKETWGRVNEARHKNVCMSWTLMNMVSFHFLHVECIHHFLLLLLLLLILHLIFHFVIRRCCCLAVRYVGQRVLISKNMLFSHFLPFISVHRCRYSMPPLLSHPANSLSSGRRHFVHSGIYLMWPCEARALRGSLFALCCVVE